MDNSSETAKKVEQMGLRTVTGQAREGFFIPYRHADNVPVRVAAYDALKPLFARQETVFADWLNRADGFAQALQGLDGSGPERARFDQYWCPRLDAAMAYTLVRTLGPENIIEIGSGHSTRFMARAIADAGADIVRISVPSMDAAEAFREIRAQVTVPLVADIHFDHKIALKVAEYGVDCLRINPGNIGRDGLV